MTSTDAQKAVDRLDKSVNAKIDERQKMLAIIAPPLQAWLRRRNAQIKQMGEELPAVQFSDASDWDDLMVGIGLFYQRQQELNQESAQENKALLAYLYRVTFEFSSVVGIAERKRLQLVFGLVNKVTKEVNANQLKKLNALAHRPIVVAESIMAGTVPFKMDETLGSFAKKVVDDKYVYTEDKKEIFFTHSRMRQFMTEHWDDLAPLKTKKAMMDYFTVQCGYTLSEKRERENTKERKERRVRKTAEQALSKGGRAYIDSTNMTDSDKAKACGLFERDMASKGFYPLSATMPLYNTLNLLLGKTPATTESIAFAIEETSAQLAKMREQQRSLIDTGIASRFIASAQEAIDAKLVTVKPGDNGKTVELAPVVAD